MFQLYLWKLIMLRTVSSLRNIHLCVVTSTPPHIQDLWRNLTFDTERNLNKWQQGLWALTGDMSEMGDNWPMVEQEQWWVPSWSRDNCQSEPRLSSRTASATCGSSTPETQFEITRKYEIEIGFRRGLGNWQPSWLVWSRIRPSDFSSFLVCLTFSITKVPTRPKFESKMLLLSLRSIYICFYCAKLNVVQPSFCCGNGWHLD